MDDPVYTEKYKGYNIEIYRDESPQNPRNFDNLGEIICFNRRYDLGDNHDYGPAQAKRLAYNGSISFPLFLYDHTSISISTTSFTGRVQYAKWDSGQVGWIIARHEKVKEEWARDKVILLEWAMNGEIPNRLKKQVEQILESEVETYDQFLRGEVYGYQVKIGKKVVDSYWGYFGDFQTEQGALDVAKKVIDEREAKR